MRFFLGMLIALIASSAYAADSYWMTTGGRSGRPIGHHAFCIENPIECTAHKVDGPLQIEMQILTHIQNINTNVNRMILPHTDQVIWGLEERWSRPQKFGDFMVADCEDYAIYKRDNLLRLGISASNLLITVVTRPDGDGHAVLTLRTDEGDYILDNLDNRILRWDATPYTYLRRQSEWHSGMWVTIVQPETVETATINEDEEHQ